MWEKIIWRLINLYRAKLCGTFLVRKDHFITLCQGESYMNISAILCWLLRHLKFVNEYDDLKAQLCTQLKQLWK